MASPRTTAHSPQPLPGRALPRGHSAAAGRCRGAGPRAAVVPADAQRSQPGGQRQPLGAQLRGDGGALGDASPGAGKYNLSTMVISIYKLNWPNYHGYKLVWGL